MRTGDKRLNWIRGLIGTLDRLKLLTVLLFVTIIVESAILVLPLVNGGARVNSLHPVGVAQTLTFGPSLFNQPISNDTDRKLDENYNGSWQMTIRSTLTFSSVSPLTEAQVALAPVYPNESLSIPAIIVQERSDGLVRVEYFAQNWPHTFGLLLYNSTRPGWSDTDITLRFESYGPRSSVNPQIAPRPNGNLTVMIGNVVVVSDYPISWASLGELYLYGLSGSHFTGGSLSITVQALSQR